MPEDLVPVAASPLHFFSADMLPAPDRMAIWREVFGREIVQLDMAPIDEGPFRYDAMFRAIGGVTVAAGTVSALSCERTTDLVRDGNDDVLILLPLQGRVRITQRGRDFTLDPGAALVRRSDDPGLTRSAAGRYLTVTLPEHELAQRLSDADRLTLSAVPADAEGLIMLRHYALMLLAPEPGIAAGPVEQRMAAAHLADLAALALGARRDAWVMAEERGGRAARLLQITTEIARNAARPGFSLADLAATLRLSQGHLRKILASDGDSFTQRLRARRLALAAAALRDPRRATQPVSAIAYDSGFSDISYFNRAFRAEFGMSPREMREATGSD